MVPLQVRIISILNPHKSNMVTFWLTWRWVCAIFLSWVLSQQWHKALQLMPYAWGDYFPGEQKNVRESLPVSAAHRLTLTHTRVFHSLSREFRLNLRDSLVLSLSRSSSLKGNISFMIPFSTITQSTTAYAQGYYSLKSGLCRKREQLHGNPFWKVWASLTTVAHTTLPQSLTRIQ